MGTARSTFCSDDVESLGRCSVSDQSSRQHQLSIPGGLPQYSNPVAAKHSLSRYAFGPSASSGAADLSADVLKTLFGEVPFSR